METVNVFYFNKLGQDIHTNTNLQ